VGYEFLLTVIDTIGYAALFVVLCLGLIGLPIPNEVVVMTGGALAAAGLLAPVPAFISTWLGICSAMTFNYSIGRFAGSKLFEWFNRKQNMQKFVAQAERLIERFGGYAVGLGLLLPFVRHAMPMVIGTNKTPFGKFALYAYPSAFVWTLLYFVIGALVGDNLRQIGDMIYEYGVYIVIALVLAAVAVVVIRASRGREQRSEDTVHRDM
jgi:membrane protein DedA with SNARE-associated domain